MFTGLVQHAAEVLAVEPTEAGRRLVMDTTGWSPEGGYVPRHGHSIAVHGVCLTVVEVGEGRLSFDVITETLACTTLGGVAAGDRLHLEPAVMPTQPMGGHVVQGHVDGVGVVTAVQADREDWRLTFSPPLADAGRENLMAYLVPKGSVALDGVSLTLAEVDPAGRTATVALIPATLDITTLGRLTPGDRLHLEADAMIKAVVQTTRQVLAAAGHGPAAHGEVTHATLRQAGFAG
jgi:riboflavin synthase